MKVFIKNLLLSLLIITPYVIFVLFKLYSLLLEPKPGSQSEPVFASEYFSECGHNREFHEELTLCERAKESRSDPFSLNYLGKTLTVEPFSVSDLVLCPGDTFGDLNDTYVTVKNCYLAMYHKDKMIWSSYIDPTYHYLQESRAGDERICGFSVKRNGNMVLFKEHSLARESRNPFKDGEILWNSQTLYYPHKIELKVQDQKLQLMQTFQDGAQKIFFADAKYQEFVEDFGEILGEPVKVADKFIIKNHQDEDQTILKRNEYIGDLNGIHLILQPNCYLQLLDKNKVIWSFTFRLWHQMMCVLKAEREGQIKLTQILTSEGKSEEWLKQSIINEPMDHREVISSKITFQEDQPIVIQTLKNGSEQIFSSGVGINNALKLKKEPRKISENTLTIVRDGRKEFSIQRMDYIGDLASLHLILEQNCSLILANGNQKLWEFQRKDDSLIMDCEVSLHSDGFIDLKKLPDSIGRHSDVKSLVRKVDYYEKNFITGLALTLKDNQLIITRQRTDKAPDLFIADSNTHGAVLQFISQGYVVVNHDDKSDFILPKMGYIGDLNGVHVVFEENCKWVLYNKSQVLWESGVFPYDHCDHCKLVLQRDGIVELLDTWAGPVWSSPINVYLDKEVLKTELVVNANGLWLINNFNDGTVLEYKAMEGTNDFQLISEKEKSDRNLDL